MSIAKYLIIAGLFLSGLGVLFFIFNKIGIHPGRLPGDIVYKKGNTTIYVPIMTCLLLSILFSVLIWLFKR